MKSSLSRNLSHFFVILAALVFLGASLTVCKSQQDKMTNNVEPTEDMATAETPDATASLKAILGEAREDFPGIQDIEQTESGFVVYYRFIPKDPDALQEELGEDLAPKVKRLYETDKTIDIIQFVVSIPFVDETGGASYKRQLSFVMTKKIFEETDWSGLLGRDFLKSVQDLKAVE